jgi:hypothetical protein
LGITRGLLRANNDIGAESIRGVFLGKIKGYHVGNLIIVKITGINVFDLCVANEGNGNFSGLLYLLWR